MSYTRVDSPSYRNASVLIAIAAFSCLVVTLLQSLVVPAVPHFPSLFDSSTTTVSWTVTATLLAGAITTPIMGRLSDLFSRRRVMVVTMTLVFVGSVIAPLGDITTIILGRALQGTGTALIPVAMAEVRHRLPKNRISSALALLSAMLGIGGGLGIPIGGVILAKFGWEAIFWFSAIMSAVSIILILTVTKRDNSASLGSFDIPGAVLLGLSLISLLTAVSQGVIWGWGSAITLSLFIGGVVLGVIWAKYELGQTSPLVNLRTMADRPILLTNVASILLGTLMYSNLLLTTLELQNPRTEGGFDWPVASAGLAMLPSAAAMLAVSPISVRMTTRYGPRVVVIVGSSIASAGYLLRLSFAPSGAFVVVWATVIAIGVGIGYAGLPMMIVKYVPAQETGSANAVNVLMRSIGMAVSSAMVAAITTALAVAANGGTVPSSGALDLLAGIGIGMGVVSATLSASAKRRDEQGRGGHHTTLDPVASDAAR